MGTQHGKGHSSFSAMSTVAKRSPISGSAKLLFIFIDAEGRGTSLIQYPQTHVTYKNAYELLCSTHLPLSPIISNLNK